MQIFKTLLVVSAALYQIVRFVDAFDGPLKNISPEGTYPYNNTNI